MERRYRSWDWAADESGIAGPELLAFLDKQRRTMELMGEVSGDLAEALG